MKVHLHIRTILVLVLSSLLVISSALSGVALITKPAIAQNSNFMRAGTPYNVNISHRTAVYSSYTTTPRSFIRSQMLGQYLHDLSSASEIANSSRISSSNPLQNLIQHRLQLQNQVSTTEQQQLTTPKSFAVPNLNTSPKVGSAQTASSAPNQPDGTITYSYNNIEYECEQVDTPCTPEPDGFEEHRILSGGLKWNFVPFSPNEFPFDAATQLLSGVTDRKLALIPFGDWSVSCNDYGHAPARSHNIFQGTAPAISPTFPTKFDPLGVYGTLSPTVDPANPQLSTLSMIGHFALNLPPGIQTPPANQLWYVCDNSILDYQLGQNGQSHDTVPITTDSDGNWVNPPSFSQPTTYDPGVQCGQHPDDPVGHTTFDCGKVVTSGYVTFVLHPYSNNHPPQPSVTVTPSSTVDAGTTVTLDARTSSDPDQGDSIVSYQWAGDPNFPDVTLNDAPPISSVSATLPFDIMSPTISFVSAAGGTSNSDGTTTKAIFPLYETTSPAAANDGSHVNTAVTTTPSSSSLSSSSPSIIMVSATSPVVQFIAPKLDQDTVLTFSLTVADNHGATATAHIPITVKAANHLPIAIAKANPSVADVLSPVTLDGSASNDPDQPSGDQITSYLWSQTDNSGFPVSITQTSPVNNGVVPPAQFNAPDRVPTKVTSDQTPPQKVPLTFSLAVTDSHNAHSADTPQSIVPVTIQCNAQDQQTIDKVKGQIDQFMSLFASHNLQHATFGFKKWLSGDNTPLDLDVNWVRSSSLIKDAEKTNEERFQNKPTTGGDSLIKTIKAVANDGQTREFGTTWDVAQKGPLPTPFRDTATEDFIFTVGSYQFTSVGNFEVSRVDAGTVLGGPTIHIHGTVHHFLSQVINKVKQAYDMFDFNPGEQFPPPSLSWLTQPLGIPTVINDELNLMKKCEGANDYQQQAGWDRTMDITNGAVVLTHRLQEQNMPSLYTGP